MYLQVSVMLFLEFVAAHSKEEKKMRRRGQKIRRETGDHEHFSLCSLFLLSSLC